MTLDKFVVAIVFFVRYRSFPPQLMQGSRKRVRHLLALITSNLRSKSINQFKNVYTPAKTVSVMFSDSVILRKV